MIKKYLKYILCSILGMFYCVSVVNATDCQYEITAPDGGYLYVRINYTGQLDHGNGKIYNCYSSTKLNGLCATESKFNIATDFPATNSKGKKYDLKLYVEDTIMDDFNSNTCPTLAYQPIDSRNDLFSKNYLINIQDNIWLGTDGYHRLDAQKTVSNGNISEDTCYETEKILTGLGVYNFKFCTKKNGDKYWKIQKGNGIYEAKTCSFNEGYLYQTTAKGFTCEYIDEPGIDDKMYFNILSEEADMMWNGRFTGLNIEVIDQEYYLTYLSNKNLKKAVLNGIIVTEKDDDPSGKHESLTEICNDINVKRVLRAVGYIGLIIKILIPLALIILGIINFSKAVISGKDDDTKKAAIGMLWGFIAAVVIFLLPTIINIIVGLIDNATDGTADYKDCRICIFEPGRCK